MNQRPGHDRSLDITLTAPASAGDSHGRPRAAGFPPARFGRYRLVDFLGAGATGEVYLYHDMVLERPVAIKLARTPGAAAYRSFAREAWAVGSIRHPNVATVHEVGRLAGRPYLVSEYIRGTSLDQLAPVPWHRALALSVDLARGLAAAHRRGILHRDIKPANAVLADTGQVKLIDFGLARWLNEPAAASRPSRRSKPSNEESGAPAGDGNGALAATWTGAPAGTPGYMAPELWHGEQATLRSDVYSFGVLLHELCTGRRPPRPSLATSAAAPAPRLDQTLPGVDPRFAAIVQRCLARAPMDRYISAETLCQALVRCAARLAGP